MAARKRKEYGEYVVSDPEICGGALTFKGTSVLVKEVLHRVAQREAWEQISESYHGTVPREAIAEALELAREALMTKEDRWRRRRIMLDEHLDEMQRRIMLEEHADSIRQRRRRLAKRNNYGNT